MDGELKSLTNGQTLTTQQIVLVRLRLMTFHAANKDGGRGNEWVTQPVDANGRDIEGHHPLWVDESAIVTIADAVARLNRKRARGSVHDF